MTKRPSKFGFLSSFASAFSGGSDWRAQKARLEAFLAAVPGEYCGWSRDGTILYSQGFCQILGISSVSGIQDIQNCLCAADSAALESMFMRMKDTAASFQINVRDRHDTKTFKISGLHGRDLSGSDYFNILWVEDITRHEEASRVHAEEQKINRSEIERLQESLDALKIPVWIRNKEQELVWCNIAYAKKIDIKPSEIIADQKEIISLTRKKKPEEKDLPTGAELARLALEKNTAQSIKTHAVLAGQRVLMKITEIPVKIQEMTVGMAEDLTAEEVLETEVKNNNTANRDLLGQLRSAIAIYGADQKLEFYNSSFSELWGLEDGWLNTKPKLGEVMEKLRETRRLPEQADFRIFKKSWLDMFTGLIDSHEDMLYLPDGSAIRMLVVPHKLGGLMMNFEDVTSRLELESSYNTLIAVQKETLDNLGEAVAVFGGDGRLKLSNPALGRLWQLNPEDLEGEPHITRLVEKYKKFFESAKWSESREKFIALGLERAMHEGRFERSDQILVDYVTVPLPDGGVLVTFDDVTDTVRVEKALRDKNAALEAAEQLKLDFLANVSYQLRTPLNAIMGFNEILDQQYFGGLNEKQKEYTRDIREASERLLGLINDILDLSSIEAGQMKIEAEQVSIKDMMRNIVELSEDWARKQSIEISLHCPQNIGKAEIDETRIKQAVINVIRNSITNTPEGGLIELSAKKRGENFEITIKDSGYGIDPQDQERILQPFERIDGQSRGAGLGLSLVQNIVSLHGGAFHLESIKGKGTTVILTLPLRQGQKQDTQKVA